MLQGDCCCLPDGCTWRSNLGDAKSAVADKLVGARFNKLHFTSKLTGTVGVSRTVGIVFPQYALTCVRTSNRSVLKPLLTTGVDFMRLDRAPWKTYCRCHSQQVAKSKRARSQASQQQLRQQLQRCWNVQSLCRTARRQGYGAPPLHRSTATSEA